MTFQRGKWVDCTPDWVLQHNACGSTVRRPKLAPCDSCGEKDYHYPGHPVVVGHQHLMVGFMEFSPLMTNSGEPE